jgi:uncharacterized membrane protein
MSDARRMRASDADRDAAAEALREHYAAGRISSDELSDRLDAVYRRRHGRSGRAHRRGLP